MKRKIAILGSTGSIGKNLVKIISKDKKNFEVILLSARKNYKELLKQAKILNAKNLIVTNKKSYYLTVKKIKNSKIKVYNNFNDFKFIFNKKIDYSMVAITGLDGLDPTLKLIKYTKQIAIANKEAIICGWNFIKKSLKKYKVKFIPVDSEHFSIWFLASKINNYTIDKIYLTASGGPFFNHSKKKLSKIKISETLKHPNWIMGKKISVDSATLMNKVFEIIEARNIFEIQYKKLSILIHRQSYIHSIIKFKNGMINFVAHDTTMEIPIFNSLYSDKIKYLPTNDIKINNLNRLTFDKVNYRLFPINKIFNVLPKKLTLFETVLVTANDKFVELYLKKKISFIDFHKILINFINLPEFNKYKKKIARKIDDIKLLSEYVRLKIDNMYI